MYLESDNSGNSSEPYDKFCNLSILSLLHTHRKQMSQTDKENEAILKAPCVVVFSAAGGLATGSLSTFVYTSLVRVVIKLDGWFVQQQLFINLNLCFCLHINGSHRLVCYRKLKRSLHDIDTARTVIFPLMLVQFWYVSCFFSYYSLCLHLFFTHEKFQQSVWLKISNTLLTITQRWIEKFSRIVRETGNTSS